MNHWHDLTTITDDKLRTFHAEAARERLAREVQTQHPRSIKRFVPAFIVAVVTSWLGLAGS
jgi:hypothetical protein